MNNLLGNCKKNIKTQTHENGEPFLYRNLRQDFILYPNDLPITMVSLWQSVKDERLIKEQLKHKLDEISKRINLCEMDRARIQPYY